MIHVHMEGVTFSTAMMRAQHLDMPLFGTIQRADVRHREFFIDVVIDQKIDPDVGILRRGKHSRKNEVAHALDFFRLDAWIVALLRWQLGRNPHRFGRAGYLDLCNDFLVALQKLLPLLELYDL